MKITKAQLKQIIKEELSSVLDEEDSNPQALYSRMLELEKQYGAHFSYFAKLGADGYSALINLRNEMHDPNDDASTNRAGYDTFQETISGRPYNISPSGAYSLWYDGVPSVEEVSSAFDEHRELKNQFKTGGGSDQTDAVYGRKRQNVTHTNTGTVVSSLTNRKGSLGT